MIVGIVMLIIFVWTVASKALSLPEWSDSIMAVAVVVAIAGWLLWVSFAPRRLVRGRAAITPPRPVAEARRQARALLNWRFIIFALLLSGIAFVGSFNVPDRDLGSWVWLVGSGAMFFGYIWMAIQKFRDR
jgi:hypothetical protein